MTGKSIYYPVNTANCKQLLDEVIVISKIIKVEVGGGYYEPELKPKAQNPY